MKRVLKILFVALAIAPGFARAEAGNEVYILDCTATYASQGKTNTARAHGKLYESGIPSRAGLRLPVFAPSMSPIYYANLMISFHPKEGSDTWRLWFSTASSPKALEEKEEEISLEAPNHAELRYLPNATDTLSFSCSLSRVDESASS